MSILGGQQRGMGSILGGGGGNPYFNPLRMLTARMPGQGASPVMAGLSGSGGGGGPPEYGTDEWALTYGGPGGLLWRQVGRGMMGSKNPLSVLDPGKAAKYYTDDTIGLLDPRFQQGYAKGKKGK